MGKKATKDRNMHYKCQNLQAVVGKWLILQYTVDFKTELFTVCWTEQIPIEKHAENTRAVITLNQLHASMLA